MLLFSHVEERVINAHALNSQFLIPKRCYAAFIVCGFLFCLSSFPRMRESSPVAEPQKAFLDGPPKGPVKPYARLMTDSQAPPDNPSPLDSRLRGNDN